MRNAVFAIVVSVCTLSCDGDTRGGDAPADGGGTDGSSDRTGDSGAGVDDAGPDADADCDSDCPQGMAHVPGYCICIDKYEYTNKQFADFLNERGDNSCGDADCRIMGWESSHQENKYEKIHEGEQSLLVMVEDIVEMKEGEFEVADDVGHFPVGYVSWYGADAACKAEGKELCKDYLWYGACSHAGDFHFPYGGTTGGAASESGFMEDHVYGACNTASAGGSGTSPVGSFETCEGGYPGIFDMIGNVEEWGAAVESGERPKLGGHWLTYDSEDGGEPGYGAGCSFFGTRLVSAITARGGSETSGFRCCIEKK